MPLRVLAKPAIFTGRVSTSSRRTSWQARGAWPSSKDLSTRSIGSRSLSNLLAHKETRTPLATPADPTLSPRNLATMATQPASGKPDARYGHLLAHMLQFHNHFRMELTEIKRSLADLERKLAPETCFLATSSKAQGKYERNIQLLLGQVVQLCRHLDMHHRIEEAHIFPVLARRIPEFATGAAHVAEHEAMHKALERIQQYCMEGVMAMRKGGGKGDDTVVFDVDTFRDLLKQLESTLLPHLDAEEKSLRAENLVKHGVTVNELMAVMV